MKIRVGSRESRLAVIQAELVMEQMRFIDPSLEPELVTMTTTGDRILDKTLEQIGGKGLFVKELDRALLEGEVDITVHSLKDMPMEQHPQLPLSAFSKREDPRDVLVLRQGLHTLPKGCVIGSASKRRAVQLQRLFPGVTVRPVRGNVQTRLARLDCGEYDALVLAAAGLKRSGLEGRISRCFAPEEMIPAAGQGILGIQCRRDSDFPWLKGLNDEKSCACALAERSFVRTLNGGCTDPSCAHATLDETGILRLTGLYVNGALEQRRGAVSGSPHEAERLGRALAEQLRGGVL